MALIYTQLTRPGVPATSIIRLNVRQKIVKLGVRPTIIKLIYLKQFLDLMHLRYL